MGDIDVDFFLKTLKQLKTNSNLNFVIDEKHQLQFLEEEIKYLRGFLKSTEKKRNEHLEVMKLVKQIRDVVSEAENIVELFKKVFGQGDCPQEDLKDVGIRNAIQCNGLPLAVVVIAEMLQTNKCKDWWETVAKSVNAFLVRNEKDCMEVLALRKLRMYPLRRWPRSTWRIWLRETSCW